jgi:hypothetical protein
MHGMTANQLLGCRRLSRFGRNQSVLYQFLLTATVSGAKRRPTATWYKRPVPAVDPLYISRRGLKGVFLARGKQFDDANRLRYHNDAGWSSLVARWAHNPKVGGSNPSPATTPKYVPLRSSPLQRRSSAARSRSQGEKPATTKLTERMGTPGSRKPDGIASERTQHHS